LAAVVEAAAVVAAVVAAEVEGAVPVWGAEAVAAAVPRQPEPVPAVAERSPEGPWGVPPWLRSPVLIAPEPGLPVGAHRAAAGPQSGAPSGPAARSFSAVAEAEVVAEVE